MTCVMQKMFFLLGTLFLCFYYTHIYTIYHQILFVHHHHHFHLSVVMSEGKDSQQQPAAAPGAPPKRRQRLETAEIDPNQAAEFEARNVHNIYSSIAQSFSNTRFKPWPKVLDFVLTTPPGGILIDVGCGNGKNMGRLPKSAGILEVGCDRSVELLQCATKRELPVVACDCLALPFRPGCADRVICIAVLHHLATVERRLEALRQMFRLLRPGTGRMLIYVWATEFAKSEIAKGRADPSVLVGGQSTTSSTSSSGHNVGCSVATEQASQSRSSNNYGGTADKSNEKEDVQPGDAKAARGASSRPDYSSEPKDGVDVFVSFATGHGQAPPTAATAPAAAAAVAVTAGTTSNSREEKAKAPGRFYHLFGPGEAEELCSRIDPEKARVVNSWMDMENYAVEVAHV